MIPVCLIFLRLIGFFDFHFFLTNCSVSQSSPYCTPFPYVAEHSFRHQECYLISYKLYILVIYYSVIAFFKSCLLAKTNMGTSFKSYHIASCTSWITILKSSVFAMTQFFISVLSITKITASVRLQYVDHIDLIRSCPPKSHADSFTFL